MRIRPAQPWQMWCCGAARRRARWIPAASPSRWRCFYVGEVLLLRYMLDDPEHTNEAQDRTSEAVAIKLI